MMVVVALFWLLVSTQDRGESDPAAILTSASMRMSLTLMGALRATVPGLFASMAQTLMDLFGASAPFVLRQVRVKRCSRENNTRTQRRFHLMRLFFLLWPQLVFKSVRKQA